MARKTVHGLHRGSKAPKLYVTQHGKTKPLPDKADEFVQSIGLERTIDAGSVLSITARDPHHFLAKQGYFTRRNPGAHEKFAPRADLFMPDPEGTAASGLWFRASNFEKVAADEFKLEFEDREIAMAREYTRPHFKMLAGSLKNPRAVFIKRLLEKAVPHAKIVIPELEKQQAVVIRHAKKAGSKTHKTIKAKKATTVEGSPMDAEQRQNAETILAVCQELHAPPIVEVAILCAAIQESTLHKTSANAAHIGVFQAFKGDYNINDVAAEARAWLQGGKDFQGGGGLAYARGHHGATPGTIAEAVEASGTKEIPNYEKHKGDAEGIVSAFGKALPSTTSAHGSSGHTERSSFTAQRAFEFPKGGSKEGQEPESAWECAQAYAKEIRWRLFCSAGVFYFISDEHLEQGPVQMEIDEGFPGISDIKWAVDYNQRKNPPRLEVDCRAHIWQAAPGEHVVIGSKQGKEIHEGSWLVNSIKRPEYTDNGVTIVLERPQKPLLEHLQEPAAKTETGAVHLPGQGGTTSEGGHNAGPVGAGNAILEKMFFQANWIETHHFPYIFGGGHNSGHNFNPSAGSSEGAIGGGHFGGPGVFSSNVGYDCSSAVSAILGPAGLLDHPYTTDGLLYWGEPGPGRYFTIHVRHGGAGGGHVYLEMKVPDSVAPGPYNFSHGVARTFTYHDEHGGAHRHNGWDAPGNESTETSGYVWTKRHWKGL